jgi:hypothetical protein
VPTDGRHLHVFVDAHETHACVSEDARAFAELWWGKRLRGVRVNLAEAPAARVGELLTDAWRRKAPRRLVEALDVGVEGQAQPANL